MRALLATVLAVVPLLIVTPAFASSLVHAGQVQRGSAPAPLELIQDDDGEEAAPADGDNPWDNVLWAPMYVPFPWSALLDGYAPWGRASWIKNFTGVCFMLCGGCMIGVFPLTLLFAVISLVLAVLAAAMSVYVFFTSGFKGGCCGVAGRGANVTNSCFSVFNGIMCLSYCLCSPWFGFKLIQRGWYAIKQDIEPAPKKHHRNDAQETPPPAAQLQPEAAPAPDPVEEGAPVPGETGAVRGPESPLAVAY